MQVEAMFKQSVSQIKQLKNEAEGLSDNNKEETVFNDKETVMANNSDADFQQGELQNHFGSKPNCAINSIHTLPARSDTSLMSNPASQPNIDAEDTKSDVFDQDNPSAATPQTPLNTRILAMRMFLPKMPTSNASLQT